MATNFFTQSYLIQAIGWGIINSLWQAGMMWLLYNAITVQNKKVPSLFKYQLGLLCMLSSLIWFIITIATCYLSLKNKPSFPEGFIVISNYQISVTVIFLLPIFSGIYLCLLSFYALQFCKQYFFLLPQRNKHLFKTPVNIRLFTQQAAMHIGIKKDVAVWLTKCVDVPSVAGYFKPVILIPFTLVNQLSTSQVEAILLHELAHIKRDDYLINLLQIIAENILCFNPFAILLSKAIKKERENCCDDWVLNYKYNQKDYAAALVLVEQYRSKQLTLVLAASDGKKNLLHRVKRIFTVTPVTHFNMQQKIKLITVFIVITAGILLTQPLLQQPVSNRFALPAKPMFRQPVHLNKITYTDEKNFFKNTKHQKLLARFTTSKKVKKLSKTIKDDTEIYATAFVNEPFLQNITEAENIATNIVKNETLATQTITVKVIEENSGWVGQKLYYLQLINSNGKTKVKPLFFINKQQSDSLNILIPN